MNQKKVLGRGLGAATLGESGGTPMRARIRAAWPAERSCATSACTSN